jgi:hypothetical protein
MGKPIDFENPGDVTKIGLFDVYQQLSLLRDDPEAFERAADSIKKAGIAQFGAGGYQGSLEALQKKIDTVVKSAPNAMQGAASVFAMMTQSFTLVVDGLIDEIDIDKAMKESATATKQ